MKIWLNKTKETKGTYVYTSNDENAAIQTLYIKKSAFPLVSEVPKQIQISIKTEC